MEAIVSALEGEQGQLEESIKLFERGQALVKRCGELLEAAQLKVQQVAGDSVVPFDEESDMNLSAIFQNKVLIVGLIAWGLAQVIKIPLDYLRTRHWNWALLFTTGGMPSSHSSLMTAITHAVGLYYGFDNPTFALGVAITMIVTYDAAGVRRQAGIHAQRLNVIFDELLKGHSVESKRNCVKCSAILPLK